jgi:hypothetical protein
MAGDEVYIDAHILKWQPLLNMLGPAHRLPAGPHRRPLPGDREGAHRAAHHPSRSPTSPG